MATRLGDRLAALRQKRFVGREQEREVLRAALVARHPPFNVLHVHGPGGVGKTTLLREFLAVARETDTPAASLDARNLEPAPEAFTAALAAALGDPAAPPAETILRRGGRLLLLVDTYELLRPLDGWLREDLLPELPDGVVTVLAGREAPAEGWRTDPGWHELVRVLPLRNLEPEQVRAYLERRAVPADQHQAVLHFTHGHPLALTLVADVLEQRPGQAFSLAESPDVIGVLLERFLSKVPSPLHRSALEACALLRLTTESLLAEVLGVDDARELFEWLRGLSFVESGPLGLFPHDLARDAISADLRWRNPERFAELHHRARGYFARRLSETTGKDQQRVLSDYVFLHRDNPLVRPFIDWAETGTMLPHPLRPEDHAALREMAERHEGPESARIAAYWMERQPQSFLVFRGSHGDPAGFMMLLRLEQADEADRAADPAVAAALDHLEARAPLRRGECATHFRFWMAADEYQAVSPVQSAVFLKVAQHYLTAPSLAFTFFPVADADFWAPFLGYIDLFPVPSAEYEVDGRRTRVYCHDWRAVPPLLWLDLLAEREIGAAPAADTERDPAPPPAPVAVLDEAEFVAAAREALRCFARPRELRRSALLRARIVVAQVGAEAPEGERVAALQGLIRRAAEPLRAVPRDAKLYDALRAGYLEPVGTHERAAARLYVSFSTFRRHLKAAVDHVVDTLWQWEVAGAPEPGEKLSSG
ncbi:MAG TPA: AAA family ATPase [Longimicrobium sp.]|nr:AAA family ATPase [Longimicrobium sp.]